MKQVKIYTDGACSGNPGPGGWAAVLLYKDNRLEISGYEPQTTSNRMELMAPIKALRRLKMPCEVKVFSDSAYLIDTFQKNWIVSWKKNNWIRSNKKAVINEDLWKEILTLTEIHSVEWIKVRGHSDDVLNNRCDELARLEIKRHTQI